MTIGRHNASSIPAKQAVFLGEFRAYGETVLTAEAKARQVTGLTSTLSLLRKETSWVAGGWWAGCSFRFADGAILEMYILGVYR